MLRTYTLYLRDGRDGPPKFEPVLCESSAEAMAPAQDIVAQLPGGCLKTTPQFAS